MSKVFWSVLMERSVQEYAVQSLLNVAMQCGALDYTRLFLPYMRTDNARNLYVKTFLEQSTDDSDVLVMLDADMIYPQDIIQRLVQWPVGVAGGLYFRRGVPHDPLFFIQNKETGKFHSIAEWENGTALIQCDIVATGAIAIKRWVFDHLDQAGIKAPYFRYAYTDDSISHPTEDMYFGLACSMAGIPHYCDVGVDIKHLTVAESDKASWQSWITDHPETFKELAT